MFGILHMGTFFLPQHHYLSLANVEERSNILPHGPQTFVTKITIYCISYKMMVGR